MANVIEVMKLSDLPVGSVIKFDANGLDVAIAHTAEGVFAIEDTCSHAEVSLSEGELNGCFLECWMHGSAFDLRTGIPKTPPAIKSVATFPIMIQGEGQDAIIAIEMSA